MPSFGTNANQGEHVSYMYTCMVTRVLLNMLDKQDFAWQLEGGRPCARLLRKLLPSLRSFGSGPRRWLSVALCPSLVDLDIQLLPLELESCGGQVLCGS